MQPKLFKEQGTAEDFQKYLPVNVNTSFKTIAPYLGLAELNYIQPLLGVELFNSLVDKYISNSITGEWEQLLDYVKYSQINLAYYTGWSVLSVSVSDSGASVKAKDNERLYRYQEEAILDTFKNNGFNIMDNVLDYLYANIETFKKFENSIFYKAQQHTLIPTTAVFNTIYNINNSRLVFLKMKHYIKLVEDVELMHHFGRDFVTELLSADGTDEKYSFIIENIRCYIVYLSLVKGIGELKKLPTEKGLIFENIADRSARDGFTKSPVPVAEVETTMQFCKATASGYLSTTIDYLKKHKEDFPKFTAWAGESESNPTIFIPNNDRKPVFFFPAHI